MTQSQKSRKNSRISIKVPLASFREENHWFDSFYLKAIPSDMRLTNLASSPQPPNKSWKSTKKQERSSARSWTSPKREKIPQITPNPNINPQKYKTRTIQHASNSLSPSIWPNKSECSTRPSSCSRPTSNGWIFNIKPRATTPWFTNEEPPPLSSLFIIFHRKNHSLSNKPTLNWILSLSIFFAINQKIILMGSIPKRWWVGIGEVQ